MYKYTRTYTYFNILLSVSYSFCSTQTGFLVSVIGRYYWFPLLFWETNHAHKIVQLYVIKTMWFAVSFSEFPVPKMLNVWATCSHFSIPILFLGDFSKVLLKNSVWLFLWFKIELVQLYFWSALFLVWFLVFLLEYSWFTMLFPAIKVSQLYMYISVQSFSRVQLFATPWTAVCQASLFITNSWDLLKLMSIELVMPSNHLILSSPSHPVFNLSQHQGLFQWVSSLH